MIVAVPVEDVEVGAAKADGHHAHEHVARPHGQTLHIADRHPRDVVKHRGAHAPATLRPGRITRLFERYCRPIRSHRSSQIELGSLSAAHSGCPAYNDTDCSAQTWNSRCLWRS